MTRRMYEFSCPDNHVFDKYIEEDAMLIKCQHCELEAHRVISAVHLGIRMGVDSSMTTMSDKWAKMHTTEAKRQNAKIDPNPSS